MLVAKEGEKESAALEASKDTTRRYGSTVLREPRKVGTKVGTGEAAASTVPWWVVKMVRRGEGSRHTGSG